MVIDHLPIWLQQIFYFILNSRHQTLKWNRIQAKIALGIKAIFFTHMTIPRRLKR